MLGSRRHRFGSACGTLAGLLLLCPAAPAHAEPIALTYSYSNLLDGGLHTVLSQGQLRAATEEALGLWAFYAPIHFFEARDAGPVPSDANYSAAGTPDIRIGHHDVEFSHAFFPWTPGGLSRDVHLSTRPADPFYWGVGNDPSPHAVDIMAVLVHELGHSLGLAHFLGEPSIMNPMLIWRYAGFGTSFLFPRDILSIQSLYGAETGSVTPLSDVPVPEPGTLLLLGVPLAVLVRRRLSAPRKGAPYMHGS